MAPNPFVWEIQVRREALDDEMTRLRAVPYVLWQQVIDAPVRKNVTARDNRTYELRVSAEFVRGSRDIRVTMSLARPTLFRRRLIRQSFVVGPDNSFKA
jgi:hypothetical protein